MTLTFPNNEVNTTKSEDKIIEFIETQKEDFLFMTINEVAETLNVSDATVSRFAKKVGCEDFKDLKNKVLNQIPSIDASKKMANTIQSEKGMGLASYLKKQMYNIEKTLENIDLKDFQKATKSIISAKKIWIFGRKSSRYLAEMLNFRLARVGLDSQILPYAGSEFVEKLAFLDKGDLVIFFSFSKLSKEAKIILDCQKNIPFQTLGFTSRLHAPKEELADINLYAYRGPIDEYHSQTVPMALVDALVINVSDELKEESLDNLKKIKTMKIKYKNFR